MNVCSSCVRARVYMCVRVHIPLVCLVSSETRRGNQPLVWELQTVICCVNAGN